MEALTTAMAQFVNHVTQTAGVYASVVMIFVFHVMLDKDMPCTCEEQLQECWSYLIIPAFVLSDIVLWIDTTFQTVLTNICRTGYKCRFCAVFLIRIVKAVCVGLLWVVSVFLDGDWYICCHNNETDHQELACKDKANNTAEEQRLRNKLAGKSMLWGLPVLLVITLLAAVLSSIEAGCKKRVLFHQIILEEGEKLVTTKMREAARDKSANKLYAKDRTWGECFDVIEDVSEEMLTDKTASPCLLDMSLES